MLFIVPLLLISSVVSVFNAPPARAAASAKEIKHIRGWLYFRAAHSCFHGWEWLGEEHVIHNKLGKDADARHVNAGMYAEGRDASGTLSCGEMIPKAISIWGYSSLSELLLDAGYTFDTNRKEYNAPYVDPGSASAKKKTGQAIWEALRKKGYTDAPENYLTKAEMYYLWHDSFVAGCTIAKEELFTDVTEEIRQKAVNDQDNYVHYSRLSEERTSLINTVGQATDTKVKTSMKTKVYHVYDKDEKSTNEDGVKVEGILCNNESMNRAESEISKWAKAAMEKAIELAKIGKSSEEDKDPAAPPDSSSDPSSEDQEDACGIDKVGWMACPVTSLLATVMDNLYSFLASNFLQTETAQVNNEEVEKVWRSFRDIANVAFVIAFMIIIYSQLTSVGLSNYGIKRMLPKLLVAAILVNLSYTLCILAVDLSNLLGYGVNQIFHAVGSSAGLEEYAGLPDGGGGQWALVFGGLLAGAVGIALAGGWSVLLAGLLAALMIVLILVLRKAAIIVLIVISPLAFVAYLLPNTEKWFHQWFKAFYTLLMLFPIIGAVFAGSKLAGDIIGSSAKEEEVLLKVVSLGVSVVPLFVVPSLLKGALASLGTLGTKLQGMADRRTERMRGAVSGKAKERFGRTSLAQAYKGAKAHRSEMKTAKGRRKMHQGLSGRIGTAIGGKDWRERAENRAMAEEQKEIDDRVSAAAARQHQSMTYDERVALAQGKDLEGNKIAVSDEEREAAVKYVSEHGNVHERQAVLASLDDVENKRIRQAAVNGARKNGDSALYGAGTLGAIEEGKHSNGNNFQQMMSQSMVKRLQEGNISNETMHRDEHTANLLANASMGYSTGADGKPDAMKPIDAGRDANGNLAATSVTAERRDAIRDSATSWQQTEDGQGTDDATKRRWNSLPGTSNQSGGGSSGGSSPSGGSSGGGGSDGNLNVRRGNRTRTNQF